MRRVERLEEADATDRPQRSYDGPRLGGVLELDRSIPVLLVRIGLNPLHHGTVGAIRSLGRLGVSVSAIVEDHFTPAARSRHLARYFCWPTTGEEPIDELVAGLDRIGEVIGTRAIAMATDDEAAILLAEHASELAKRFILPSVPASLPRQLATKSGLHRLCLQHGIPTAATMRPRRQEDVAEIADALGFPLVVKNDEPWLRLIRPGVANTTFIHDPLELRRMVDSWAAMPRVVMQRYLPRERSADWIAHAYFGDEPDQQVIFTGRKLRSWPPHAGVTTRAYTCSNAELASLTAQFCGKVGFRGICDLDWRFDSLSGRYNLMDFNPRLGAQFRLFESVSGVDVARAMHLDLTARPLPLGRQIEGRSYVVGNLDLAAGIAYRWSRERERVALERRRRELAWWAPDDPLPALLACVRSGTYGAMRLLTGRLGSSRIS
jgi:predicted ATP-grasp superfamily ATP-dependent carboligase